jgi:glycosyltransferase involved in cell wall biosynthesis
LNTNRSKIPLNISKRVAVIGIVGLPPLYGGFETLTAQLVEELAYRFDFTVFCSGRSTTTRQRSYRGARLRYLPIHANGASSVIYDFVSILLAVRERPGALLVLGVSGSLMFPFVRLFSPNIRLVVNVDGIEWKRAKWGRTTQMFLKLCERIAVRYATTVIADNKGIVDHIAVSYGRKVKTIAYGGDHVEVSRAPLHTELGLPMSGYVCGVCRIEPENNVEMILQAHSEANTTRPLVLVGNWDSSSYGRRLRDQYQSTDRYLVGPIYDSKYVDAIRSFCDLYVHGHSAGGTNPSLVEAMHLAKPIAAYDVCFNRYTMESRGIFFSSAADLKDIFERLDELEMKQVGEDLCSIARRRYTWAGICSEYAEVLSE